MGETDRHRLLIIALTETLIAWYESQRRVYVSGNLLLFYEEGNRRRHVSPDVLVVKGVENRERPNYLLWEEGKGPDLVIEITSSSTRREDLHDKFQLYQDTLRVKEYFLFDPLGDYLSPPLQGFRLRQGVYRPIRPVAGRLPSQVVRLHLESSGQDLWLFDPVTDRRLLTPREMKAEAEAARQQATQAEAARQQEEAARQQAEAREQQSEAARQQAEAENERLRQEIAALRRRLGKDSTEEQ
jgi:Uma2 family endonuclease